MEDQAVVDDIFSKFERKAQDSKPMQYMTFKKGDFLYGAESSEMDSETEFVVDMRSMFSGWTCWVNKKPIDEIKIMTLEGDPPSEDDLPDHTAEYTDPKDDGWSQTSGFLMREKEGERLQFSFKGGSKGIIRAIGELCDAFIKEGRKQGDPTLCPVINLVPDSYPHPTYGKVFVPSFRVTGWMTQAEAEEHFGIQKAPDAVEKPKEQKKLERK